LANKRPNKQDNLPFPTITSTILLAVTKSSNQAYNLTSSRTPSNSSSVGRSRMNGLEAFQEEQQF